jgi:hypothetical protein
MEFKVGDWVIYGLSIGQIKAIHQDEWYMFADGHIESSGMNADRFRPLTLSNKRIVDIFDIYYNRLRDIPGEAGFNYPAISQYFEKLALEAIDTPGSNEPFVKAQSFVQDARDYKALIQGVLLFRPKR